MTDSSTAKNKSAKAKKGSLMNLVDKINNTGTTNNRRSTLQRSNSEGTMSVFTSAPPEPAMDVFKEATALPDKPSDWASYWLDHKKDRKKEKKEHSSKTNKESRSGRKEKRTGIQRQRSRSLSDLKVEKRGGKKKEKSNKKTTTTTTTTGSSTSTNAMAQWESLVQKVENQDEHNEQADVVTPLKPSKKDTKPSKKTSKKSRMTKTRSRSLTDVRRRRSSKTFTNNNNINHDDDDNKTHMTELSKVAQMANELDQHVSEIGATFNWIQNGRDAIQRMSAKAKVAVTSHHELEAGERARASKDAQRRQKRQQRQLERTKSKTAAKVQEEIERSEVISVVSSVNQSLLDKMTTKRQVLDDDDRTVLSEYTNSHLAKDLAAKARQSLTTHHNQTTTTTNSNSKSESKDMLEQRLDRIARRSQKQSKQAKTTADPRTQAKGRVETVKGQVLAERAALMESEHQRLTAASNNKKSSRRDTLQRVRSRSLTDLRRGLAKDRNNYNDNDNDDDEDSVGTRAMNTRANAQSFQYLDTEPDQFLSVDQDELDVIETKNRIKQLQKQLKHVHVQESQELATIHQQATEWSELNQAAIQTKKVIKILRLENEAYRINQKLMKEDMFSMHQQAQRMEQEAEDTYKYYTQLESLHKAEVIKARALQRNVPQFQSSLQQKQAQLQRRVLFVRFEHRLKQLYTKYLAAIVGLFHDKSAQKDLIRELSTIALGQYSTEQYEKYFCVLNNSTTGPPKKISADGGKAVESSGNRNAKQKASKEKTRSVDVEVDDSSDDSSYEESSDEEDDDNV